MSPRNSAQPNARFRSRAATHVCKENGSFPYIRARAVRGQRGHVADYAGDRETRAQLRYVGYGGSRGNDRPAGHADALGCEQMQGYLFGRPAPEASPPELEQARIRAVFIGPAT